MSNTPKKIILVQTWSIFTWILTAMVIGAAVATAGSLYAITALLIVYVLWEASHICTRIDLEAGTITKWRGLLLLRLLTRKTRPLSEASHATNNTRVKRGSNSFITGTTTISFSGDSGWEVFFSGIKYRAEAASQAAAGAIRGAVPKEVAGFVFRQKLLQASRYAVSGFTGLCLMIGLIVGGYSLVKSGLKEANFASKAASSPCEALYDCCRKSSKGKKRRRQCKAIKSMPEDACRPAIADAVSSGKCG